MFRALLPIDRSVDRAAAQAEAVTRLPGTADEVEAQLLYVHDERSTADAASPTDLDAGERASELLMEAGVTVSEEIRHGDPAQEIVGTADDENADLIVLGGRKRSALGSMLFGSVSQEVVLNADRPVTITGDERPSDPSHVCRSCGERYFAVESEIDTCRSCGGTKVEPAS